MRSSEIWYCGQLVNLPLHVSSYIIVETIQIWSGHEGISSGWHNLEISRIATLESNGSFKEYILDPGLHHGVHYLNINDDIDVETQPSEPGEKTGT